MGSEFSDSLLAHQNVSYSTTVSARKLTPFSIIATLSARRAVESRWVINITVLSLSPVGVLEILFIVSKICV
jgi:hypothetical protein